MLDKKGDGRLTREELPKLSPPPGRGGRQGWYGGKRRTAGGGPEPIEQALRVADSIEAGMVFVNHPTMVKADLPFGGVRRSGYGRELLGLGLKEFVNHKLIDVVDIDAPF